MARLFTSDKIGIAFRGAQKHFEESGNEQVIEHLINAHSAQSKININSQDVKRVINETFRRNGFIFMFNPMAWMGRIGDRDFDGILARKLNESEYQLVAYKGLNKVGVEIINAPTLSSAIGDWRPTYSNGFRTITISGITQSYFIAPDDIDLDELPEHWLEVTDEEINAVDGEVATGPVLEVTNSILTINEGNNNMTKVTAIVSANKAAAANVAKLEAGRIGIKQAVKLVKPAMPMMARGYLDHPLGQLAVANLFKFGVDNFAAGNEKAKLVADAMLEGAMLEAIQSLNIEKLISDIVDNVDISKITSLAKADE